MSETELLKKTCRKSCKGKRISKIVTMRGTITELYIVPFLQNRLADLEGVCRV